MPRRKKHPPLKVLYASSEAWPLMKTGGLGDVANALPNALAQQNLDVRVALPAYRPVLEQVEDLQILGWLVLASHGSLRVLQAYHPAFTMPLWLIDSCSLFDRPGSPYQQDSGSEWPDNPARFAAFSEAVALLALDALEMNWRADVVHANDWQTGLIGAFLEKDPAPPRRIFTIHNIAYDCQVDFAAFQQLGLPAHWWSVEKGEFYNRFSFLKTGIISCDAVTTVSPTYASEIRTSEFGYGLAGVLEANSDKLTGILNGIDDATWDPATDTALVSNYAFDERLDNAKRANRKALLEALGAAPDAVGDTAPLIGFVGRLVYQKGIDLLLAVIPDILEQSSARFVVIGSGDKELEARLAGLRSHYPNRVFTFIGYSERMAHRLEAASDLFVMPSRYEPCGLNQLYSLRYGTPPVVHRTGGLADTVVDANEENLANGKANGFVFDTATPDALRDALLRALNLIQDPDTRTRLIKAGMKSDWGWQRSAADYLALYRNS